MYTVRFIRLLSGGVEIPNLVRLLRDTRVIVFPLELTVFVERVFESVRDGFVFHGTWILGINGLFDQLVIRGHEKLFLFGRQTAVDRFRRPDLARPCLRQPVRILTIRLEL